jgi:plastocyanin
MKFINAVRRWWRRFLCLGSAGLVLMSVTLDATSVGVSVADNFFSPKVVNINAGDTVLWTWIGANSHSSTRTTSPMTWDSTILTGSGHTFSQTFSSAGNFPYFCTVHAAAPTFQTGLVAVAAVNLPPSVGIISPTNNANFAAPWTGSIQATNKDSDGTVTKVDFRAGTTLLGTVSNPPATATFTVTNLAAGNYNLTAIATDNSGASKTSAVVAITVLTPGPIHLTSPQRISASNFQFLYTATPGLNYVVRRSGALPAFIPLRTNTAATNNVTFLDTSATGAFNAYSVKLLPNP